MYSHPRALRALPAPRQYPRNKEKVLRKLFAGAIAGAVMLAVAAIAFATTTQTYDQKYIDKKGKVTKAKNASIGTSFSTASTEDGNAENNHQPKSTRQFNITFPPGSAIDYTAAPVCKKLDETASNPCPKNTKIGSGHAQVLLPFNGTQPIKAVVTAYNRKSGLFLYVVPSVGAPVVLKPVYKGLTLKTATPPNCVGSTNQNGHCIDSSGQPGVEAVLTEFDLKTKPIKKGKKIYLRSPKTCPKSKVWTFKAEIKYDGGSTAKPKSTTPC
jgi:hypothetical protein